MKLISSDYMEPILGQNRRDATLKIALKHLAPHIRQFTSFVSIGHSSLILSSILADRLNKNLIIIRKNLESCHSAYLVEGLTHQTCVFIDDLVASGSTIRTVKKEVESFSSKLYGAYFYTGSYSRGCEVSNNTPDLRRRQTPGQVWNFHANNYREQFLSEWNTPPLSSSIPPPLILESSIYELPSFNRWRTAKETGYTAAVKEIENSAIPY